MTLPVIECFSDLHCPWAYLASFRLRQIWPEYRARLTLRWRALALEYINRRGTPKPILDLEIPLIQQIEPTLPITRWSRPEWEWPTTFWPAFEALLCAQAQHADAAFELQWRIRVAFFGEQRCVALRHELLALAQEVAKVAPLDVARFEADWDSGRFKAQVLADSRQGWHTLRVAGSPTFVLPSGEHVHNPAAGQATIDEETLTLRDYQPFQGDALAAYRALLERALQAPPHPTA